MFLNILLLRVEPESRDKVERLYYEYRLRLHYLVNGIVKDEKKAEDIVQDTYLAVIENIDKIDENNKIRTWSYLSTIAKHKSYNILKRDKRWVLEEDDSCFDDHETNTGDFLHGIIKKEESQLLSSLIEQLRYPYKEVLILKYYHDMDSRAIGKLLDLKPANVRQIQRRALTRIRQEMKGYLHEDE